MHPVLNLNTQLNGRSTRSIAGSALVHWASDREVEGSIHEIFWFAWFARTFFLLQVLGFRLMFLGFRVAFAGFRVRFLGFRVRF